MQNFEDNDFGRKEGWKLWWSLTKDTRYCIFFRQKMLQIFVSPFNSVNICNCLVLHSESSRGKGNGSVGVLRLHLDCDDPSTSFLAHNLQITRHTRD